MSCLCPIYKNLSGLSCSLEAHQGAIYPQDYPSWGGLQSSLCLTSSDIIPLGFQVAGSYPKWGQQGLTVYPSQVTVIDVSKAGGACYFYTLPMATKSCCLVLSVAAGTRAAA